MDQKKAAEAIDQAAFRHSLGDVGKQARMPRLGFEVVSDADQAKHSVLQHSHFSKAKGKSLGEIPMPKKVIQSEVDREKTKSMISSHDKHPPIKVAKINGEHVVVDGHHRLAVAKALGKTKIKAELVESEMNEDDLLEGETPEERERRLKASREALGLKPKKKSSDGIKASYFLKRFQGKLPGRKVTVGDMNKESMDEESCKGKKGMKTFKEYFEEQTKRVNPLSYIRVDPNNKTPKDKLGKVGQFGAKDDLGDDALYKKALADAQEYGKTQFAGEYTLSHIGANGIKIPAGSVAKTRKMMRESEEQLDEESAKLATKSMLVIWSRVALGLKEKSRRLKVIRSL